jgi:hypothetical protein
MLFRYQGTCPRGAGCDPDLQWGSEFGRTGSYLVETPGGSYLYVFGDHDGKLELLRGRNGLERYWRYLAAAIVTVAGIVLAIDGEPVAAVALVVVAGAIVAGALRRSPTVAGLLVRWHRH